MAVGDESIKYEIMLGGEQLGKVSEFKYLAYLLDKKGTNDAECTRKVVSGRKEDVAIQSLVNTMWRFPVCTRFVWGYVVNGVNVYHQNYGVE